MAVYAGSLANFTSDNFIIDSSFSDRASIVPSAGRGFAVFPASQNTAIFTQPIVMPQIYAVSTAIAGHVAHLIQYCTNVYFSPSVVSEAELQTYRWKLGISWAVFKERSGRSLITEDFGDEVTALINISRFPGDIYQRIRVVPNGKCDRVRHGNTFQIKLRRLGTDVEDNLTTTDIWIAGLSLYETDD